MAQPSYNDAVEMVRRLYNFELGGQGTWTQVSNDLAKYGYNTDNYMQYFEDSPNFEVLRMSDGSARQITYKGVTTYSDAASDISSTINSNTGTSLVTTSADISIPGELVIESGATSGSFKAGLAQTGNFIFKTVAPAIGAASVGISLGKTVDGAIYNIGEKLNLNPPWALNPDTWGSLLADATGGTFDDPAYAEYWGGKALPYLLGINADGSTQAYMDEDAFSAYAMWLASQGFFAQGTEVEGEDVVLGLLDKSTLLRMTGVQFLYKYIGPTATSDRGAGTISQLIADNQWVNDSGIVVQDGSTLRWLDDYAIANGNITSVSADGSTGTLATSVRVDYNHYIYSYNNGTSYPRYYSHGGDSYAYFGYVYNSDLIGTVASANLLFTGNIISGNIDGVGDQTGAIIPTSSDTDAWTGPNATKQALKNKYPSLWDGAVSNTVPQSDGSTKTHTYIPVGLPSFDPTPQGQSNPSTKTSTQLKPQFDPKTDSANKQLEASIPTLLVDPVNTSDVPDTGQGDSPVVIPPTGEASALWSVYNPTQAQLNSFGSWLWSSDFFSQLKKLFNDPMQAIIGVHKVFASPIISGQSTIKCGYIDSNVPSNVVGSQYVIVDCGSVSLREYFGNVFDYAPYTEVKLFLPFIGVVPLDTAYVMRGSISVKYHVDVITGSCLAEVSIRRDSAGGIIYTFGGSCIVQYPVSAGSYMNIVGVATGAILGGFSLGTGNVIGATFGFAQALQSAHQNVQHSGGFTGNAGAMGVKKPYLIISRPQTELNGHEPHMSGLPSNDYITLSSRSGYIRCKHVHVTGLDYATASEKDEIEQLLKDGVVI